MSTPTEPSTQELLAELREAIRRRRFAGGLVGTFLAVAVLVAVLVPVSHLDGQVDVLGSRLQSVNARLDDRSADARVLASQVRALGGTPAVQVTESPAEGQRVRVVQLGPEQVRAAVRADLREHPPKPGPKPTVAEVTRIVARIVARNPPVDGRDARPASGAELAAAVASYCAVRGECQGRPPTNDQVAVVVNQIIAQDPERFRGAQGEPGRDGASCPQGYEFRPVVAVTADGGGYRDAVQCVNPDSAYSPQPPPSSPGLLPPG